MPVIKILPHPEYCPAGAEITAPAGTYKKKTLLRNGTRRKGALGVLCG